MKELSVEEKAKAYDRAIEKAKNCLKDGTITNTAISYIGTIFPELSESEEERVRKELITHCRNIRCVTEEGAEGIAKWIAWLEKQGEHKSAWSQEDCSKVQRICKYLNEAKKYYADITEVRECIDWLKSLKDRVQPKQEWSKEDKVMLDEIIDFFENGTVKLQHDLSLYASWLKSLTGRYTWKPSEWQMETLKKATHIVGSKYKSCLASLYQDLKKLKG